MATDLGKVGEAYVELRGSFAQILRDLAQARQRLSKDAASIGAEAGAKISDGFRGATDSVEELRKRLGTLVQVASIGLLVAKATELGNRIADAGEQVSLMRAKLLSLTGGNEAFQLARQSADKLGQAVGDTASSMGRLAIAGRNISLSVKDVQSLTEAMTMLGRVGGSSGEELSSVVFQLSQAMASGRLQGDELRSVMENMPLLAQYLAKELKVGTDELKKLGEQGAITARVVRDAFLNNLPEIQREFAKLPQIGEQGAARAANAWQDAFARLDKAWGASEFRKGWYELSARAANAVAGVVEAMPAMSARRQIDATLGERGNTRLQLDDAQKQLDTYYRRLEALQDTLAKAQGGQGGGLLGRMVDPATVRAQIADVERDIATAQERADSLFVKLGQLSDKADAGSTALIDMMVPKTDAIIGGPGSYQDMSDKLKSTLDELRKQARETGDELKVFATPAEKVAAIRDRLTKEREALERKRGSAPDKEIDAVLAARTKLANAEIAAIEAKDKSDEKAEKRTGRIQGLIDDLKRAAAEATMGERDAYIAQQVARLPEDRTAAEVAQVREAADAAYLAGQRTEIAAKMQEAYNRQLELARSVAEEVRSPTEAYASTIQRLNDLLMAGVLAEETYARAAQDAADVKLEAERNLLDMERARAKRVNDPRSLTEVGDNVLKRLAMDGVDNLKVVEDVTVDALTGIEGALMQVGRSGESVFDSLRNTAIAAAEDIHQALIRNLVIEPLAGAVGTGIKAVANGSVSAMFTGLFQKDGGVVGDGGQMSVKRFARGGVQLPPLVKRGVGGVATSAKAAIFAEAGNPEAYVPTVPGSEGPAVPLRMTAGGLRVSLPGGRTIPTKMFAAGGLMDAGWIATPNTAGPSATAATIHDRPTERRERARGKESGGGAPLIGSMSIDARESIDPVLMDARIKRAVGESLAALRRNPLLAQRIG